MRRLSTTELKPNLIKGIIDEGLPDLARRYDATKHDQIAFMIEAGDGSSMMYVGFMPRDQMLTTLRREFGTQGSHAAAEFIDAGCDRKSVLCYVFALGCHYCTELDLATLRRAPASNRSRKERSS